jgi:hypothetical protein
MFNKILISCAVLLLTISVRADELTINPGHPENYTVVKGDTLWDISARFLQEPWRWPEIWGDNPQIYNPHLIYPGDIVSLLYEDGEPVLNLERGTSQLVTGRNVKLYPTIISTQNAEAIQSIPIDAIQQFLEQSIVLDENEIEQWPYIVSNYDGHLMASSGDIIYVRDIPKESKIVKYSIYRKGASYVAPKKAHEKVEGEILGFEALYIGDATIQKRGDPASAIITIADKEVMKGDRLFPHTNEGFTNEFVPRTTNSVMKGSILSVLDGVSEISQYQVVVLNLGKEQGLEVGNILGVYQSDYVVEDRIGPNIKKDNSQKDTEITKESNDANGGLTKILVQAVDATIRSGLDVIGGINSFEESYLAIANKQAKSKNVSLPEEYVGVVMVLKTFSKVSYAMVMEAKRPMHVLDTIRSL